MAILVATLAGCVGAVPGSGTTGSTQPTSTPDLHMAGPAVRVQVTQAALDSKPKPWVLTTPESAVRSYLDWTSYAYRTTQSDVATPTMTGPESIRIDSYIQLNIEQYRLIDQVLLSIAFGKAKATGTSAVLTATEKWVYRYISIQTAGKVLEGPYAASYETTYTLAKSAKGWIVDKVEAKALGEVK
jgi:hypothetical protein